MWCTLTLIVSKLDLLFFNHLHIHLPSLRSTMNSITYSIICSICCSGFRSGPPAISKAAVISPMNHVFSLLTVCISRLFMNNLQCLVPNRPILAPYNPICTPISHCFTCVCSQSHLAKTCAVSAARISVLFIFVCKKKVYMLHTLWYHFLTPVWLWGNLCICDRIIRGGFLASSFARPDMFSI